ncbi:MAG: TIM barrel protein [Chloroflexi bacterium]|nr:TIM barrel protein [Chloroflexota bacterium]
MVGFNMHPRWAFGELLPGFLEPLRAAGLRALECELWDGDPDWLRFLPLMEECQRLGLKLCFHAPYRGSLYNVSGFAGEKRVEIKTAFARMLDVAARFAPAPVVFHGARSATESHDALYADTVAFLEWVLDCYPLLVPALENLGPNPRLVKIGTSRIDILNIVERIGDPRLGLCWDMGHDVLAGRPSIPKEAFLRRVVHVHVHDVDEHGTDHYPLLYGRVPYRAWLPTLVQAGFGGIVTLEIKGGQLVHLKLEQIKQSLVASVAEIARLLAVPAPTPGPSPNSGGGEEKPSPPRVGGN